MRLKPISRKVYLSILLVSMICIITMLATVLLVNEDLEHTMLQVEFDQERDLILLNNKSDETFVLDTPNVSVVFIPFGQAHPATMPSIFKDLPENYSAEIEQGRQTYLVTVKQVETGLLYLAKDITHFEDREALFHGALVVIALVIIVLSLILAVLSGRHIAKPLTLLSKRISRIPVGPHMPRMETDYTDAELYSIATTCNRLMDELGTCVSRSPSLFTLVSHEMRSPIAVM